MTPDPYEPDPSNPASPFNSTIDTDPNDLSRQPSPVKPPTRRGPPTDVGKNTIPPDDGTSV